MAVKSTSPSTDTKGTPKGTGGKHLSEKDAKLIEKAKSGKSLTKEDIKAIQELKKNGVISQEEADKLIKNKNTPNKTDTPNKSKSATQPTKSSF